MVSSVAALGCLGSSVAAAASSGAAFGSCLQAAAASSGAAFCSRLQPAAASSGAAFCSRLQPAAASSGAAFCSRFQPGRGSGGSFFAKYFWLKPSPLSGNLFLMKFSRHLRRISCSSAVNLSSLCLVEVNATPVPESSAGFAGRFLLFFQSPEPEPAEPQARELSLPSPPFLLRGPHGDSVVQDQVLCGDSSLSAAGDLVATFGEPQPPAESLDLSFTTPLEFQLPSGDLGPLSPQSKADERSPCAVSMLALAVGETNLASSFPFFHADHSRPDFCPPSSLGLFPHAGEESARLWTFPDSEILELDWVALPQDPVAARSHPPPPVFDVLVETLSQPPPLDLPSSTFSFRSSTPSSKVGFIVSESLSGDKYRFISSSSGSKSSISAPRQFTSTEFTLKLAFIVSPIFKLNNGITAYISHSPIITNNNISEDCHQILETMFQVQSGLLLNGQSLPYWILSEPSPDMDPNH
nr:hypothetical protein Iba_chr12fCG3450 [Ipomoea batatas]